MACTRIADTEKKECVLYGSSPEENSMLYWFPKIKNLGIPFPETIIQKVSKNGWELASIIDGDFSSIKDDWNDILASARKIGFPLFMRTDEFSSKHNWDNTCYVPNEESLQAHIITLVDDSLATGMIGLPVRAFVFRKYVQMATIFTAFYHHTPINPEVRFFIKDGKVDCHHWYWVTKAIEEGTPQKKLPHKWKKALTEVRLRTEKQEIPLLTEYAEKIAKEFPGFWSVDFCQALNGQWFLIDMAQGNVSYHPAEGEL